MLFILGYLTGAVITLLMVLGVFFIYFHNQQAIERAISQQIAKAKPKGDFIKTPTDIELFKKDKVDELLKIKNEIRLGDIDV